MTREKDKKPGKDQQLLEAARLGQLDQLETLLNQFQQLRTKKRTNPLASLRKRVGPNTIRDPVTGFTCLHHAALNGHSQAVQLIVNYGGKLNAVDYKGSTALHLAAWSGNLQVVKTLISCLREPQMTTTTETETFSGQGNYRSATLSASSGAAAAKSTSISPDSATTRAPLAVQTNKQQIKSSSPKHSKHTSQQQQQQQQQAASPDANDCVVQQQKLEIDHRNNDNQTALSLAAQFGHSQVVAELLAHGANPNLRNNQLESPLDLACFNGHLDTVRVLLNSSSHLVEDLRKPHSTISISTYPFSHVQVPPTPQQEDGLANKRHPSVSGWSSLLRGTTMKDLSPTSDRSNKMQRRATMAPGGGDGGGEQQSTATTSHQYSLNSSRPTISERLLDHSPLHYAVRRGHLTIVDLLLSYYEANIYQLTSLGSVMHELVMGNHSFREATRGCSAKNYPYNDMMRVFLTRLGQMSAKDPNETRTRWQHLLSARNGQQRNIFDMLNDINNQTAQELQRAILDLGEHMEHNLNRQTVNQLDQQQQQQQQRQRQQVFTNSQHLNSFVTMKRAPKQQQQAELTHTTREFQSYGQPRQGIPMHDGTQTIGRRKISAKSREQSTDAAHLNYQFGQTEGLARSISSLAQNHNQAMTQQQADLMERPSTINWPALSAQQNLQFAQQLQQQMLNQNSQVVRNKRSKSRDLGSILKEVNQNGGTPSDQEQLYDNQLLPSLGQQLNHLVRSQTDCSHLLGRFLGQHEDQQQVVPNGGRSSGEHRLHAADLARQLYQQQSHQYAHSSENSSLISGLDRDRLVPTSIAHQHSATLDRRAINRHYHVYEHEFYPPRLVTAATHQVQANKPAATHHVSSERQKQVVAIVPPLVHNPTHSIDGSHRFANSTDLAATVNNSRLSLNMDQDNRHRDMINRNELLDVGHQQHDQMNRFVGRSRKSTGGQLNSTMVDTNVDTNQQRPALMARPQSMHSSQSLESRLGADSQQALSFENTRRALMRDFDKMIGRELLNTGNKYSDHSSDGGQSSHSRRIVNSTSSSSQNSILTGVSLDMDTRGEHLIVSGTRITMPEMQDPPLAATMLNQSASSGSMRSSSPSRQASQRVSPRDSSILASGRMSLQQTQTGSDNLSQSSLASSVDQTKQPPPQKPPRPSLESQQIYRALQMGGRTMSDLKQQQDSPVIYDVPSHNNSLSNLADPTPVPRRPGSRTSINSSVALPATPMSVVPPARPPQPKPRRSGIGNETGGEQVSITQPPTERPPPPPVPPAPATLSSSPSITSPLEVITATSRRDRLARVPVRPNLKMSLSSSSSCNSPTSSTSSTFKLATVNQRQEFTLGGDGDRREHGAQNTARRAAHIIQATELADSGVCTSNSPASTSHDSESGGLPLGEVPDTSCSYSKLSSFAIMAPPSPRTAQMSIEEAFMPLEETTTQEVANQTNQDECPLDSDSDDEEKEEEDGGESGRRDEPCFILDEEIELATSFELGSQVDEIFGWLGSSNKSPEDRQLELPASTQIRPGYENCIDLQDRLRASRCRSIGELFRGIASAESNEKELNPSELSGRSTATGCTPVKLAPAQVCSSEEGDYAATSETQGADQSKSCFSTDNPSSSLEITRSTDDGNHYESESATPIRQCKEIMVRVVVDESQRETNGDDVFYISPLELKKISSKTDMASKSTTTIDASTGQHSEAETLTEEELCASVDKSSGYIRFTLRKRRAASAAPSNSHVNSPLQSLEHRIVSEATSDCEPIESSSAKRTKMNSDVKNGDATTNVELPEPMAHSNQCENNETTMQQVIEDEERKNQINSQRKASGDSFSMDISQTSSSSSTSGMSIKSIVSLKAQQPELPRATEPARPASPVENKQLDKITVDLEISETQVLLEQTLTPTSVAQPLPPKQVEEQVKKTIAPKVATSLVSETARRLEAAAAAARAANGGPPPAAVARRTLNRNCSNAEKMCEKENAKPLALPPKKSICWPPKKVNDDDSEKVVAPMKVKANRTDETTNASVIKTTTSTPTGPVIGRVSANRLSFQRLIEEKSKAAAAANSTLNRPKPPPPVKPAGLILPQSFKS